MSRTVSFLKTNDEFSATRRGARRRNYGPFTFFVSRNDESGKVGIVVPNTVGKAVVRVKVKRRLREVVDAAAREGRITHTLVIQARPGADQCSYADLVSYVNSALR